MPVEETDDRGRKTRTTEAKVAGGSISSSTVRARAIAIAEFIRNLRPQPYLPSQPCEPSALCGGAHLIPVAWARPERIERTLSATAS